MKIEPLLCILSVIIGEQLLKKSEFFPAGRRTGDTMTFLNFLSGRFAKQFFIDGELVLGAAKTDVALPSVGVEAFAVGRSRLKGNDFSILFFGKVAYAQVGHAAHHHEFFLFLLPRIGIVGIR